MMRIWMVNHYAVPPSSSGGTRHYSLARHLIAKGHEVVIVAANYNHFTHTYMVPPQKNGSLDRSGEVPFYWVNVPPYKGNTVARFWNMLVFAWNLGKSKSVEGLIKPDIIIGSSPHLFSALGAERLARKWKIPFVIEIRDIWPDTLVDLGKFTHRHPLIKVMKQIEKYLYRRANKVITLLPCAKDYLHQYGVKNADILWLPNSVELGWMQPERAVRRDRFTVMYAGAHGLANDLDTVLHAAEILQKKGYADKIRITLVGEGPERARLIAEARDKDISMVEFVDSVPKNEIYAILKKADVYLMLLKKSPVFRWGISPNKLFDYFAMQRPVIFGVDTPMDPVKEAEAGVSIPSSHPEALADAIIDLYGRPEEELAAMASRGRKHVSEFHDIANLADSLEAMLSGLTS